MKVSMVEIKIDATKLKSEGSDVLNTLSNFLKEKTSSDLTNDRGKMVLNTEGAGVDKKYVKVLLKKFLHQQKLKETYRVVGAEEGLSINERKIYEEE